VEAEVTNQWGYDILGLAGKQGAGKDYFFERLVDVLPGRNVRRMAFADGVRREVSREVITALGFDIKDDAGLGLWQKPYTEGQRWLLQQWGTEFRRTQDPEYWVLYGLDYISEHANEGDLWVVTDVRFKNEADAIKMVGGITAEVQAVDTVRAERLGITQRELWERSKHASEVMDFDTTCTIYNSDFTLPDNRLAAWLGMDVGCYKCRTMQVHGFHDGGAING
jgi:hypothetical protein